MKRFEQLDSDEQYEILLARLEHEHELTNSRMMWLLTFQGFLFATIAIADEGDKLLLPRAFFQKLVPLIGIVSAFAVLVGILASWLARRRIKAMGADVIAAGFPGFGPSKLGSWLGLVPGFGVPLLLVLAWLWAYCHASG